MGNIPSRMLIQDRTATYLRHKSKVKNSGIEEEFLKNPDLSLEKEGEHFDEDILILSKDLNKFVKEEKQSNISCLENTEEESYTTKKDTKTPNTIIENAAVGTSKEIFDSNNEAARGIIW